ncbi:MAG: hypothetical protein HQM10_10730 [Candidatus Riflebacteria bacterium]|nr:hypothetical protein [Candidatus Riflebacteria bacterium]
MSKSAQRMIKRDMKYLGLLFIAYASVFLFWNYSCHAQDAENIPSEDCTSDQSITQDNSSSGKNESRDINTVFIEIDDDWSRFRDIFKNPAKVVDEPKPAVTKFVTSTGEVEKIRLPAVLGIMIASDKDRVAITSEGIKRKGQRCADFTVKTISKKEVVFCRNEKDYVVKIKE